MIAPQPPGPGLPLQAPSVKISTSVTRASGRRLEPAGQLEHHPLDDALVLDLRDVEILAQALHKLANEDFGGRSAGGDAERGDAVEPGDVERRAISLTAAWRFEVA